MKHKTYSIIFMAILAFINIAYGMDLPAAPLPQSPTAECNLPKRDLREGEVPANYVHCSIPRQMKFYRKKVYDPALRGYEGNAEALKTQPIPGLSLVMENAFALVNDYITKDPWITEDEKKRYKYVLKKLWRMVIAEENGLTSAMFQHFNERLANLMDAYKEKDLDSITMRIILKPYNDESFDLSRKNVVFIIYGNPNSEAKNRNISPFHFVRQYCHPFYSAYIAFFDVLSMKRENPTKRDPHWSVENGTFRMLSHDLDHMSTQVTRLLGAKKHLFHACQVAENYKNDGKPNEYKVISNFLFLAIHEMPVMVNADSPKTYFERVIPAISHAFKWLYEHGSTLYKQEQRDWEFVLKDTYIDPITGERKVVHDQEGKPFLPVQWDSTQMKVTRPFPDSPTRKSDMKAALLDGYSRYMKYVAHLLENDMEKTEG